jgi:hypothetical protein
MELILAVSVCVWNTEGRCGFQNIIRFQKLRLKYFLPLKDALYYLLILCSQHVLALCVNVRNTFPTTLFLRREEGLEYVGLNGDLKWILKRRELNAKSMQNMSGLT